ncbi:ComF family protein [Candidatus Nitrosacidococcus tergens]|uniref:Competence protein F n=1 Tax=Candidatus Nitrosacidococcus tergens TaxID=553981 RepID=A0A7G1QBF9_9GAMM|nr:ComF family protein [Candidatus Nitrosacidococcus tergens]CAB1276997.1 Competence protein F [Candidatus Nitrosacidococcus tergens]
MFIQNVSLILTALKQSLYPPACILCGAAGDLGLDLCIPCRSELPLLGTVCSRCSNPLTENTPILCGTCQQDPPLQKSTLCPYRYDQPIDYLIQQLKFHHKLYLAPLFGELMVQFLKTRLNTMPECIIPVPLYPKRLRDRGFNQALEIARPIARAFNIPIDYQSVKRVRDTPPQLGLLQVDRKINLHNAFLVKKNIQVKHVAIVDDVFTTGTTVGELAKVLYQSGVERVEVWVCARTLLK